MADKLMYIPDDDTPNYPFCRLQLVAETLDIQIKYLTNQNWIKVPMVVKLTYNITLFKTLGIN